MNEKERKQQTNMMKTTVGVTVGKIVEASTTKDVDQSLIEVWQYGLWSFLVGVAKLGRFLPKGAFANYVCIQGWVGGQKNAKFTT